MRMQDQSHSLIHMNGFVLYLSLALGLGSSGVSVACLPCLLPARHTFHPKPGQGEGGTSVSHHKSEPDKRNRLHRTEGHVIMHPASRVVIVAGEYGASVSAG
jgi:hypothetical protein